MNTTTSAGAVAPIINSVEQAGDTSATGALVEHAEAIRTLGKSVIGGVIEIGRRLTECKALLKRGQWLPWLEQEFGWSDDTAANYIRVYKLTQEEEFQYRNFRNLNIGVSALYLISQQSVPAEVRTEIIERAEAGKVPIAEVKRAIKAHKKPAPAKSVTVDTTASIAKTATSTGNDVDTEQSAEQRKQATAADEVAEVTNPTSVKATRSMSTAEKKRRGKIAAYMVGAHNALELLINAVDNDPFEWIDGARLDQLLNIASELIEKAQSARDRAV